MLISAIDRLGGLVQANKILVLTASHLTESISLACPDVLAENILTEPAKRNTAGCNCWLAANLLASGVDPNECVLAILPADHRIRPDEAFRATAEAAFSIAEDSGALVTIGIRPTRPETGYGYIEIDQSVTPIMSNEQRWFQGLQFHEKPSHDLATTYVESHAFLWNSGMFFWRLDAFLNQLRRTAPKHFSIVNRLVPLIRDHKALEAERVFCELPDISIDYAVMERATHVAVVEAGFDWDDVGSWDALSRLVDTDARGNATIGDAVLVKSADCVVHNTSKELTVCLVGAYDLLVVATDDAVLICDKDDVQSVRDVVAKLRESGSAKL